MCGIGGILCNEDKEYAQDILEFIQNALPHRGPDHAGSYTFERGGFIHTRLSIIAPSASSHQPFISPDKRYILTYNGEIYNFKQLRHTLSSDYTFKTECDTEVVLAAYIKWKEHCLDHFNGMFAFAIYDTHTKQLFASRDRLGIKPLYYYHQDETFIFASEFKAIADSPGFQKDLNLDAINHYLTLDYIPAPHTIDQKIKKLEAGHYLTLQESTLKLSQYWDIPTTQTDTKQTLNDQIEQLDTRLNSSIKNVAPPPP